MSRFENPICLALDVARRDEMIRLVEATAPHVGVFKIGSTAFSGCGPGIVGEVASVRPVFLDLKLHDIPAQVEGAVGAARRLGAAYTTVHASGGVDMIKAAVAAAGDELAVLGVTVLTSLDDVDLERVGVGGGVRDQVVRLAELALAAGARGLVCSPREVAVLRSRFGPEPLLVVPGIRASGSDHHDQRRAETPAEAIRAGADLLVIGRPVRAAANPAAAARRLLEELEA
ncbi:MAG: orotidine-5'-phosphate decarboxylase [Actinomycetota bacterium]